MNFYKSNAVASKAVQEGHLTYYVNTADGKSKVSESQPMKCIYCLVEENFDSAKYIERDSMDLTRLE